jgi:feruloyl esterase
MRILNGCLTAAVLAAMFATRSQAAGTACGQLASLAIPNASITQAVLVAAGAFSPPEGGGNPRAFSALPAFCRVAATLKPSADSDIKIEVWLPAAGWNGKFQAVGNGAFSGSIAYPAMAAALARGYATSSTDTGHTGNTASWAIGHPEKVTDFGWRAVHELTNASKQIITTHYDQAPRFSYWTGCSAGGRQGMKAAQRFPNDFDGIVAGSPGLDWTSRAARAVHVEKALQANPDARLLQPARQLLHAAVVAACDAHDGVKDGLIENPHQCKFDPGVLECRGAADGSCLSKAQVETARLMYADVVQPRTKRIIAGLAPGSELGWTDLGWTASARATGLDQFRFIVFGDPAWTIDKFNVETDVARAEEADRDIINALDPNLKPFIDRGGKMIAYHGWSDPQISPLNVTHYHRRVLEAVGAAKVNAAYRLFMAPGMDHCGGGEGPGLSPADALAALEQWVEHGKAPDQIIASHATKGVVDRTRPLCPYPQVAAYKGTGSIDEAASFVCKAP